METLVAVDILMMHVSMNDFLVDILVDNFVARQDSILTFNKTRDNLVVTRFLNDEIMMEIMKGIHLN